MKALLTYFLVAILLLSPLLVMADEMADAMLQAKMDAERDANGSLWCILGGFFGIWPVIIGYIMDPTPNAYSLMNKSSEYVAAYTEIYKSQVKSIRGKQALTGCIVSDAVFVVFYVKYVVILSASLANM